MADDTTPSPEATTSEPSPAEPSPVEPSPAASAEPLEVVEEAPQEVEPTAEAPVAPTAPPQPSVAATLMAEPLEATSAPLVATTTAAATGEGEGGEWELLLQKLGQWLNQNELQTLWAQASKPVTALAALVGLLLVLRIYSALLGALDSLPLVPGLLELAGVVWVVRYGVPKLLRSSERERLLGGLNQRWKAFRGKS
jgi:hypothetical protein